MFKKSWSLLALAAVGSMVFATVDLRTNIQDIYYRGTCEEAGTITMSVEGDDFFEASTETPVFIRVKFDKGARLCSTLVERSTAANPTDVPRPIYLAMRVEGASANTSEIRALPEAVSIVRWRAGEDQIWLRVQQSSSQWLYNTTSLVLGPPDPNRKVVWSFGVTARSSYQRNNGLFPTQANLPSNTTDVVASTTAINGSSEYWAVSTLICVNVSTSILTAAPALDSELNFDTISFLHETAPSVYNASSTAGIVPDDQSNANFSGDDTIARGIPKSCSMTAAKNAPVSAPLCLTLGGQGQQDLDQICMVNNLTLNVTCDYGWNGGSSIEVRTGAGANYGFPIGTYNAGDDTYDVIGWSAWSPANGTNNFEYYADASDVFIDACGNALADTVIIDYPAVVNDDDADRTFQIQLSGTVCMCYSYDPTDVVLSITGKFSNRGEVYEDFPFDGTGDDGSGRGEITAGDQRKKCPPSTVSVGPVSWPFGSFGPCVGEPVVIFYPYLPKVYDTPFWTGVSYVNHGANDFDAGEVVARIYEADGSLWTASFPALPTKNQHTWLLAEHDEGVGFKDLDGVNGFVPLTAGGSDLVPLDKKSSMFVIGTLVGTTTVDIAGGDLDGFCLIGNTQTNVIYGYTVRNVQPGIAHIGDLPIVQAKRK